MRGLHMLAFVLVVIGALNWLVTAFNYNAVEAISLGINLPLLANVVYILVGLSGIYLVVTHARDCRNCNPNLGNGKSKRR